MMEKVILKIIKILIRKYNKIYVKKKYREIVNDKERKRLSVDSLVLTTMGGYFRRAETGTIGTYRIPTDVKYWK